MRKDDETLDICRRAQAIVDEHPELAFDDVRRALMRLRLTPRQRLDRIIASKKAIHRDRDRMALPVLEANLKASGEAPAHEQGPANGLRPKP